MNVLMKNMVLLLVVVAPVPLAGQGKGGTTPTRVQVIAAAKEIMQTARYCTLVTIGPDGQPQARIVDPFLPDSALTVWMATSPVTRKVQDIRRDARVTLVYFNPAAFEYVTLIGTAALDTDSLHKARHWKSEWAGLYKNQNRGEDYMLLRFSPTRLEIASQMRGMFNDPKTLRPVILDLP
jgi:general stress protein 26